MLYQFILKYPQNYTPESVDTVLRKLFLPRKWRHFLRKHENVLINNEYLPINFLVYPGDNIEIKLTHVESTQQKYPSSGQLPKVIYEDNMVLIIDKKAGQKTHPNWKENNTALNDCTTYLGKSPYVVHRLDMLTTGLLLVAKTPAAVPILNKQLVDKTLNRQYLAVVKNDINLPNQGTISLPIGQDPDDQRKKIITENGKNAITHFKKISVKNNLATLQISLETGRTHQIRVHLASLGYPIIGDPLYNPAYKDGEFLKLRAYSLTFTKPFSFERKTVNLLDEKKD